jgi:hypothetical protein
MGLSSDVSAIQSWMKPPSSQWQQASRLLLDVLHALGRPDAQTHGRIDDSPSYFPAEMKGMIGGLEMKKPAIGRDCCGVEWGRFIDGAWGLERRFPIRHAVVDA